MSITSVPRELSARHKAAPGHGSESAVAELPRANAPRVANAATCAPELPVLRLLGLPIHNVTQRQAVEHILTCLDRRVGGWVMTPNVDILRRWVRDESFRRLTARVSLCVADGMPLVWASRLLGQPLPERVTGADLSQALLSAVAERPISAFFLGGAPGAADLASAAMRHHYPGLSIAGTHCPPYGFEKQPAEWQRIEEILREAQPDIVFVGLGSPKQEIVIERCQKLLPSAWWLGVGVTFSFLGGTIARAPGWMQRNGLEWLHRLTREPQRLAHRYLVDDLPFAGWLLGSAAVGRFRRPAAPAPTALSTADAVTSACPSRDFATECMSAGGDTVTMPRSERGSR